MSTSQVSNPYVVGGWVTGDRFYGHVELRHNLLYGADDFLWVIGTRRVGKTSLLRQLALEAKPSYVPLYWDMQGCENLDELAAELLFAIEESPAYQAGANDGGLGLVHADLEELDARGLIRQFCRAVERQGRRVLLLIDEPEVLIAIAQQDGTGVQRLRAALQRPTNLRVVLASTKALTQMDSIGQTWLTSPFLHGFAPRHLAGLHPQEAEALVRQVHRPGDGNSHRVEVSPETVAAIQEMTNNHPYLMQWLCYRLYQRESQSLRLPTDADIVLDSMLDSLFALTYKHLSPTERRILIYLLQADAAPTADVAANLGLSPEATHAYLYALNRLGYTRKVQVTGLNAIGNRFFLRWLETNADRLHLDDAEVADAPIQALAAIGQELEKAHWLEELRVLRVNLAKLDVQRANYGLNPPLSLQNEIDFHLRRIKEIEYRLDAG